MANIFYQKLKCLLSVASNLLLAFVNASLLLHSFLKFASKTRYVWQGVIVAISRRIRVMCVKALTGDAKFGKINVCRIANYTDHRITSFHKLHHQIHILLRRKCK